MITLRLTNFAELQRRHAYLLAENEKMISEAADSAGKLAHYHVDSFPTFKRQTGNLQRSTTSKVIRRPNGRLLVLDNRAPYADPIDKGAMPHPIVARNAPNLVFWWAKIGRLFVGKRVNHPGNKPYRFMYNAWRFASEGTEAFLVRRMNLLARRF